MNCRTANALILPILLSTTLFSGCAEEASDEFQAPLVHAVKTIEVSGGASNRTRVLSGYVQAVQFAELSFQVGGQVLEVRVTPGDKVDEGDVLARIDRKPFELHVTTADAELGRARAELKERHENYLSQQRVFEKNYISRSTFEVAAAEYAKAQSGVQLAESNLALAKRDLTNSILAAPFDGIITKRLLEPFQMVSGSATVLELQGESELEVVLLLPGNMVESIAIGDPVTVSIPTANLEGLSAVVSERSIQADTKGSFPIVATLMDPSPGVLAGMPAEISIASKADEARIVVPDTAIAVDESGQSYVLVFNPDTSTLEKTVVSRERFSNTEAMITSGLEDGQRIVVAGTEFLRNGMTVHLYVPPSNDAIPTEAGPQ